MQHRHNPFLFWGIVGGCFLFIFSFWVVSVKNDVVAFSHSIQKGFSEGNTTLKQQWKQSEAEAKALLGKHKPTLTAEQLSALSKAVANAATTSDSSSFPEVKNVSVSGDTAVDPAKQFCSRNGGLYELRKTAQGNSLGVCTFLDGSECEAIAFSRGECHKGQYTHVNSAVADLPDLMPEVTRADYCKKVAGEWTWVNGPSDATHVCFDSVIVRNQSSVVAPKSTLSIGGQLYPIPSLGFNEGYTIKKPSAVKITDSLKEVDVMVDAKETIKERDEKNNLATFIVQHLK